MQEFAYERPETLADAVAAMRGGDARALAGGTDLIPQLREGRREARRIVDLKRVPELTAIASLADGGVSIGAAASATAIAQHPSVAKSYPAVAGSARLIGSLPSLAFAPLRLRPARSYTRPENSPSKCAWSPNPSPSA